MINEDVTTWRLLLVEWLENTGHRTDTQVICDYYSAYDVRIGFVHNGIQASLYVSPYNIQLDRNDVDVDHLDDFSLDKFDIQNPDKTLDEIFEPIQKAMDSMEVRAHDGK